MTNASLLRPLSLLGLLALSAATQAQTAPPIKPGLWQVQSERETDGQKAPDLGEHLKSMSPAMRQRMEASMKQHGIDMSGPPGQMKMCQTRESLDQGKWQGEQGACKTDFTTRSGSVWKWKSTCSQPPSVTDGEAAFTGPESYTVKSTTSMTMQGQAHVTKMTIKAKWLGADCGDLKPLQIKPPPAKPAAKP
ncbi:MAG: DUF3617 domain-containing protein [Cytophagales bacterium]|nr:DUF3617 domain-containing protein [Rhizobacter sp.]